MGTDLVAGQAELAKHWSALRFGPTTVEQQGDQYLFHVQVFLDDVHPDAVRVELNAVPLEAPFILWHEAPSWR